MRAISRTVTAPEALFEAVPAGLPLGQPLADISMGWDGTVWGIDTKGVPYQFDLVEQTWQIVGRGYSAVAQSLDLRLPMNHILFRDGEYSDGDAPQAIGQRWPGLPDSFKLGVTGAATVGGLLYLFCAGRYVRVDQPASMVALTSLANWPTTPNWMAGSIDAVGSKASNDGGDARVLLFRGGEFIEVDLVARRVVGQPQPLRARFGGQLLAVLQAGFDAMVIRNGPLTAASGYYVFQGPICWYSADGKAANPSYPIYRQEWTPSLAQAPSGRLGDLWGFIRSDSFAFCYDGTKWRPSPDLPDDAAIGSLAVGRDATVVALTDDGPPYKLYQLDQSKCAWSLLASTNAQLVQVSLGDAGHVWARDSQNRVYRYQNGALTQVNLGRAASDIAATPDGTLWHCDGTAATVYRFLSGGSLPSQTLPVGQGAVTKVTSTGFGAAYVLGHQGGSTQLSSYHSPYLFKTDGSYNTYGSGLGTAFATGASTVFLNSDVGAVALDAHTGAELWRGPHGARGLVFDAYHQLVYVNTGYNIAAFGLDGPTPVWQTGALAWATTDAMALDHGMLYFGSHETDFDPDIDGGGEGEIRAIDTTDALHQSDPQNITLASALQFDGEQIGDPAFYGVMGIDSFASDDTTIYVAGRYRREMQDTIGVFVLAVSRTSPNRVAWSHRQADVVNRLGASVQLTLGQAVFGANPEPALLVSMEDRVVALQLSSRGQQSLTFTAPGVSGGNGFTSGLAYSGGVAYVGDHSGTLYALDGYLKMTNRTPVQLHAGHPVISEVLVVTDAAGAAYVLAATSGDQGVWLFDTSKGTTTQLATDQTQVTNLALDRGGGIVYTAGQVTDGHSLGEVFAIRVSEAVQAEQSFVVDSQLMQDYDERVRGQLTASARYQTHVTVVDHQGAPRARQPVKLWADSATTVMVEGRSYDIDSVIPARLETDGTGSLTIVSDATDLFAVTLRLWASFMDPDERVVVHPDQQFHARLTTTTAGGSDDPHVVNLATAKSYDDGQLFTDASQAQNTAAAVQTLTTSTGLGGGPPPSASLSSPKAQRGRPAGPGSQQRRRGGAGGSPPAANRGPLGVAYLAANTPALRAVSIQASTGLVFEGGTYRQVPVAEAANQLDAMSSPAVLLAVGGILDDITTAWHEIKQAVTKEVKKVVVSIGDVITAGLHYVVDGLPRVVKAVVTSIEEVAALVGAFFVQLGKDLVKVLEALSLFFAFDKILITHKFIRGFFDDMLDTKRPTSLAALLTANAATIRSEFENAESTIDATFESLINQIKGTWSGPIGNLPGMGSTPSSVLTVPAAGGSPQSHAVQGMWALNKVKQHIGEATIPARLGDTGDPIADLVSHVLQHVQSDANLNKAYQESKNNFQGLSRISSPEQLLTSVLTVLLELVKDAVVTGVAVAGALVDSLLDAIGEIVGALGHLGDIDIPILPALWHKFTGNDTLSFVDLVALVFAIPVTYLYRALAGEWPAASEVSAGLADSGTQMLARIRGLMVSFAFLTAGVLTALNDLLFIAAPGVLTTGVTGKVVGVVLLLLMAGTAYVAVFQHPSAATFVLCVGAINNVIANIIGAMGGGAALVTGVSCVFAVLAMIAIPFKDEGAKRQTLAGDLLAQVPPLINWVKFLDPKSLVPFIAPLFNLLFRWAVAGLTLDATIESWNALGGPAPRHA
jgi:hypothetical protein